MKKLYTTVFLAIYSLAGFAQISDGGFPLGTQSKFNMGPAPVTYVKMLQGEAGAKKWESKDGVKPPLVALTLATQLGFPGSGKLSTLENGISIWRAQLQVTDARALGLYFDEFYLPDGVKFYLSNKNGRQVLGAYTSKNNDPGHKFATEPIEGELINLELNIDPGVKFSEIKLNINKAATYFAGIEHLQGYRDFQPLSRYDTNFTGRSSVCMINALCPQGNGYEVQRNAALNILFPVIVDGVEYVATCSATMVNTTGNTPSNCKQYVLLASHCQGSNSIADSTFSQVILRFNYQHSVCSPAEGIIPNTDQTTMVGAKFVARSVLPFLPGEVEITGDSIADANKLRGDFMLLELKSAIPASWNINLAGWNNSADIPLTNTGDRKFIGFHHPGGDVKKVSFTDTIEPNGGIASPGSHWGTIMDSGLTAQGSSGSALFDGDGREIGIASFAPMGSGVPDDCALDSRGEDVRFKTSRTLYYSKISYVWDYSVDGPAAYRKLKPWLDPINSNVPTINAVKSDCNPLNGGTTGITIDKDKLDESISVFPNPSTNGLITVYINLPDFRPVQLELYDISGRKLKTYNIGNVRKHNLEIDLGNEPNGTFLLKFADGKGVASKKIMLIK